MNRQVTSRLAVLSLLTVVALIAVSVPATRPASAVTAPAQAQPVARGVQIPVIVNVYPGGKYSEGAIRKANDILRQAGMKLVVVEKNTIGANSGGAGEWGGDNGADGGTAGDGTFTRGERDRMRTFGGQELRDLPNHRGIKISFGQTPSSTSTTPGISVHRDPTIIVKDRGNDSDTGQTIAHEIGHLMTLGEGHKIDGTTNADSAGHTPNRAGNTGNGNIMAPSNRRNGTHLTPDQIAEMQRRRYVHGKCASQWERAYPAQRETQQFGATTDLLGDQQVGMPPIYDIHEVVLTSLQTDPDVAVQFTVFDPMPPEVYIDVAYNLGFDFDNDTNTGGIFAGVPGIDRVASVVITGTLDLAPLNISGLIYYLPGGMAHPFDAAPQVVTDYAYVDLDEPADPVATSVLFTLTKEVMGLIDPMAEAEVPVVAATSMSGEPLEMPPFDAAKFLFDRERWLRDPELITGGTGVPTAGEPYPVDILGLASEDPFVLYLNDTPVLSGTLDAEGAFHGAFVFPTDVPTSEFHFLTAQDSTGEFAYNITCPEAEPPTVEATSPADGAMDVAPSMPIGITFSEPIEPNSFAYSCTPDPGGWVATWQPGDTQVELQHAPFAVNTPYTFTIETAEDIAGNPLAPGPAPNPWSFTTGTTLYHIYLPVLIKQ
ncbi:MAG: Ig-like domain-containing protein [Anaerolineae bacterium]|nr:Ig-like domain-containing protein [Anaerolineae bacterium]